MKKNIIIISSNSTEDIKWQKKIILAHSSIYNIKILMYDSLIYEKENLKKEVSKLKEITKSMNEYIIISKNLGILISVYGIVNNLINPQILIGIEIPLKCINKNDDFIKNVKIVSQKTKVFIIDGYSNWHENYKKIKTEIQQFIPVLLINKKKYNCSREVNKIIDTIIKINNNNIDIYNVTALNMHRAIIKIDKNRTKYKFYNNWLSDAENKILIFCYKGATYVAKRVNSNKSSLEINNYKILNEIIIKLQNNTNYNLKIEEPSYCKVNDKYGYIISKFYGNDLNHLYYNNSYKKDKELQRVLTLVYSKLIKNNIIYNGFLPRNIILKDKDIYFIDFEDINKKSMIATETNLKIAWSYFFNTNYNLESKISFDNEFSKYFIRNKLTNEYKNPYDVAVKAESSYNNQIYRIDDSINVLSNYLPFEVEIMLDIIIYESKLEKNNIIIEFICSLAQKVRVIEILNKKDIVKNTIKKEIKEFFISLKNKDHTIKYKDKVEKIIKLVEKIDN